MAKFSLIGEQLNLVANVIIAATLSNTLMKLGIIFSRGSKVTAKLGGYIFGSVIVVGTIYILIMS